MKKFSILLAVTMMSFHVHAQLKVNADGDAALKDDVRPGYAFTIVSTGTQTPLFAEKKNTSGTWAKSIESHCRPANSTWGAGILATAYKSENSSGRTFGVLGQAGYGTSGYNYGVYGQLIDNKYGAAVYGTTNATEYGIPTGGRYAGYFHGPVKVDGALTVTGNINGVLLNTVPASTSIESLRLANHVVYSQLGRLKVQTHYIESPEVIAGNHNSQWIADSDTIEVAIPLSSMEKQVLSKQHYGLDADQLEEVFPDLVYECEDGTKGINYVEMVPILVQAINELSEKIAILENDGRKMVRTTTDTATQSEDVQLLFLGQNKPNPFSSQTSVEVTIPVDVQTAFIYVYDLNGKKLQQVDISARGKQNIQLSSTGLDEGMYLYSLIADGKVVETRRMIVEK